MKWYFSRKNLFKVANETLLFAIRCDIRCVCCSLQSPSSPTNITFTSHKRYKWIWSESQQTTAWSSLHQSYQSFIDNFWFPSNDFIRKARALSLYINTNATTYYHLPPPPPPPPSPPDSSPPVSSCFVILTKTLSKCDVTLATTASKVSLTLLRRILPHLARSIFSRVVGLVFYNSIHWSTVQRWWVTGFGCLSVDASQLRFYNIYGSISSTQKPQYFNHFFRHKESSPVTSTIIV